MYNNEDLLRVLSELSRNVSRLADAEERTANMLEKLYSCPTADTQTSNSDDSDPEIDLSQLFV